MIDVYEDTQVASTGSGPMSSTPTADVPEKPRETRVRQPLIATILADACKGATRYVYSYDAGRGAE